MIFKCRLGIQGLKEYGFGVLDLAILDSSLPFQNSSPHRMGRHDSQE